MRLFWYDQKRLFPWIFLKFFLKDIADLFHNGFTVIMVIIKLFMIFLLQSCAGYKLVGETNLFRAHGVKAVVVDQAKNNSSFSGITRYFANSITSELSSLPGFHIQNKLGKSVGEAVVVAELTSEPNPSKSKEVEA